MHGGKIATAASNLAVLLALTGLCVCQSALADSITGPLTSAEVAGFTSGASYGPPPAVRFFEPGPITVASGTTTDLYSGPGQFVDAGGLNPIDSLLFVLSLNGADVASLGTITFDIATIGSVDFGPGDFFTSAAAGFPTTPPGGSGIDGIAGGEVNGIKFPQASHAAVQVVLDDLGTFGSFDDIGDVTVTSPVNLRIDIFGIEGGTIFNNTPNSGALGVTLIPLPAASWMGMLTLGALGAVWRVRGRGTPC